MNTFKFEQTENKIRLSIDKNNEEDMQELTEIRNRESNCNDISALADLMDYPGINKIGNGWTVISADQLGNLSEAPMLIENLDIKDNGDFETHEDTKIYYFDNYQVRHFMDDLIKYGEAIFQKLS